jgi:E3 ubiquitin-protein ligase NRDP1
MNYCLKLSSDSLSKIKSVKSHLKTSFSNKCQMFKVCKRIPNKQAVLILACDNKHMPNHLVVEPGVVLIFAHGVE